MSALLIVSMTNVQLNRVRKPIRILQGWTVAILISLIVLLKKGVAFKDFYQFGPSENLVILGLVVNDYVLYSGIIFYSFFNTVIRNMNNQVVCAWITLVVHDTTISKDHIPQLYIYEITLMSAIYTYIDWFIYLNLVFSQIDIILIELAGELFITFMVTRMYLETSVPAVPSTDMPAEEMQIDETLPFEPDNVEMTEMQ
jgi:hypothetical protein